MKRQTVVVYVLVFVVLVGAVFLVEYRQNEFPHNTQPSVTLSTHTPMISVIQTPSAQLTQPTQPTTHKTEPTTTLTTVPTEPPVSYIVPATYPEINTFGTSIQVPDLPFPAENASEEEWYAFFFGMLHTYGSWYNMALTSEYNNPDELDVGNFFYNGTRWEQPPLTDQEKSFLEKFNVDPNIECRRMPVSEMDSILDIYFNTDLSKYNLSTVVGFRYFETTDCYYFCNNGANCAEVWGIVDYGISDDGVYRVRYVKDSVLGPVLAEVTLKCVGNYFQILSNLVIE